MRTTILMLACAACALLATQRAHAQSPGHTPTAKEAQQARDNARRDARLADQMEKERLQLEAQKPAVYIPPEPKNDDKDDAKDRKPEMTKPGKPQYFTAVEPGYRKAKKKKKAD